MFYRVSWSHTKNNQVNSLSLADNHSPLNFESNASRPYKINKNKEDKRFNVKKSIVPLYYMNDFKENNNNLYRITHSGKEKVILIHVKDVVKYRTNILPFFQCRMKF